ncbi:UNVERIFIED_CONTAM: hypothetical protein K2H54_068314 [Gekko kuhli]
MRIFGGKLADPDGRTGEFPMSLESGDGVGRGGPEFWRPHLQRRRSDQQLPNHPRGLSPCPQGTIYQPVNMSTVPREMRERVRPPNAGGGGTILIGLSPGSGRGEMASSSEERGSCQGCSALRRRLEEFETVVETRSFCVT